MAQVYTMSGSGKNAQAKLKLRLTMLVAAMVIGGVGAYIITNTYAATRNERMSFRVASYNILGAGYPQAPPFNQKKGTTTVSRASTATKTAKAQGIDVIGLQETDAVDAQFSKFVAQMPGYSHHPADTNGDYRTWQRTIFWKTSRFTAVGRGDINYPFQDAPYFNKNDKAPWVHLRDVKSGLSFYVLNMHMSRRNNAECRYKCNPPGTPGGSDEFSAQKRRESAKAIAEWVATKKANDPIIVMGDFNSSFMPTNNESTVINRSELPYCILTATTGATQSAQGSSSGEQLMRSVYDAAAGRTGTCPNTSTKRIIDHIYITQGFRVESLKRHRDDNTRVTSDHLPVIAKLSMRYDRATGKVRQIPNTEVQDTGFRIDDNYFPEDAEVLSGD